MFEKRTNYLKSGKVAVTNTVASNVTSGVASNNMATYSNSNPVVGNNAVRNSMSPKMDNTQGTSNNVSRQPMSRTYSSDLSKSWPKIVNDLKQNGKIVLYTNLMNTSAEQINDNTVGIKFKKGMTAFGKAVLDKQENIKEISSLVSLACGKDMQIKYINDAQNSVVVHNPEDDIQRLASESNIPWNMMWK